MCVVSSASEASLKWTLEVLHALTLWLQLHFSLPKVATWLKQKGFKTLLDCCHATVSLPGKGYLISITAKSTQPDRPAYQAHIEQHYLSPHTAKNPGSLFTLCQ